MGEEISSVSRTVALSLGRNAKRPRRSRRAASIQRSPSTSRGPLVRPRYAQGDGLFRVLENLAPVLSWHRRRGVCIGGEWHAPSKSLRALTDHIYERHFCKWTAPDAQRRRGDDLAGDPAFLSKLKHATGGAMYWEPGW